MLERCLDLKALCLGMILLVVGCSRSDSVTATLAPTLDSPPPTSTATTPDPTLDSAGPIFVVQRGKVVKTLEFDGRVSPLEETPLYFKTLGYVKQVHVKQGDWVETGDLLAELETDDLLIQIAQGKVALNSAQLLLSEAEKYAEQEIALAELDVSVAQTILAQAEPANAYAISQSELALVLAQEQLSRTKTLQATYTANVVRARVGLEQAGAAVERAEIENREALDRLWEPQEIRDAYALALQSAQWNQEIAQVQYSQAIAESAGYQHDRNIQEIQVEQAEAELERLRNGVDPLLALQVQRAQQTLDWLKEGVDPALINSVNMAQLALERLRGQLDNAQIVTPMDGEILSLSIYPGRAVEPFSTVIVIADPLGIQVSAALSGEQLEEMSEGQKATVVLSTDPNRIWSGAVLRLPYPYGTKGSSESEVSVDISTYINLEGNVSELNLGDLVHVIIALEEKDDVLWLPPAAIRTLQGRKFVTVQDDNRQRRIDVEVGIESQTQTEILEGVEQGQIVIAP